MTGFMIRFFICNIAISMIIGILLAVKRLFKHCLSNRLQYNLWFLLLGLLMIPFLPLRFIGLPQILSLLSGFDSSSAFHTGTAVGEAVENSQIADANWLNDFVLSVDKKAPSAAGYILFGVWLTGIVLMILLAVKSSLRLHTLKTSALPVQNQKVRSLYKCCLAEAGITKAIPIYSTAFLKSPVMVGLFKPCIYLPIHLISDYQESSMRYMLLHELQHYKYKDALASYLMIVASVFYWFNPFVWYALKEMRNDRELACDTSVLELLDENSYIDYGNTLINFAEKISLTSFPFASGLSGTISQMKRRIINIASYEKPNRQKRWKGTVIFILIAIGLIGLTPFVSTYAANAEYYQWNTSSRTIAELDCSAYFEAFEGSFVLYNLQDDTWNIHDMEHAAMRVSPNSTYKIYDALFGLEEGIISPDDSLLPWNGEIYPFETWNTDQTLNSAMSSSVNWYFQTMDRQLGADSIYKYLQKIGYGNERIAGALSSYWLESSLKISPIEQVELLTQLHADNLGFAAENTNAVKDSIQLFSSENSTFYGKTGTGRINDHDVNGWFIGFIETFDNTYFFATNIKADQQATGSNAAEITMSILSDMGIWK